MTGYKKRTRLLVILTMFVVVSAALMSLTASAERSFLQRLLDNGAVEMTVVSEPERIWPGWNPHHTLTLVNTLDEPLTNLEVIAPVPEGLCLPQDGERSSVPGEYDPEQSAMVWRIDSLAPGEELVAHVVWHSYSYLDHGQQIVAEFEYRADGYGGGTSAPPVVVDRAESDGLGTYPTLTLTPSPTPSPTPVPILQLVPEQVTLQRNQRQVITCTVATVEDLYGLDVALLYDPTKLTFLDAEWDRVGDQVWCGIAPMPDFVARNEVDTDVGLIQYTVTQLGGRDPFAGTGVVLTFEIAYYGYVNDATTIAWVSHELATSDGLLIPHRIGPAVEVELLGTSEFQPTRAPRVPSPTPASSATPTPTLLPSGSPTQLSVLPATATLRVGESIKVSVVISDVIGLYGEDIRLAYDPTLLTIADADPSVSGTQLVSGDAPVPGYVVRNQAEDGEAWYAVTQLNPTPPYAGSGIAFSFEATAMAPGECPLTFTYAKMADYLGQEIFHDDHDGLLVISGEAENQIEVKAEAETMVSILPQQATLQVGDVIQVSVVVSDVFELYGEDIIVSYDPAVLDITDADPAIDGVQVTQGHAPEVDFEVRNRVERGEIHYAVAQLNPREPFSGSGMAFSFEATALALGDHPLTFSYLKLLDRSGQELSHATSDALLTIAESTFLPGVRASETKPGPDASSRGDALSRD